MRKLFYCLMLVTLVMGCRREKEVIVPDNVAPPDGTIANTILESYVNRSYILLVGYKPDDAQMTAAVQTLRSHEVSMADRETFLSGLMALPSYSYRLFEQGRADLLNSVDTLDIQGEIALVNLLLQDSQYASIWPILIQERDKLQDVLNIPSQLANGSIDVIEMHRRLVYNRVYDQINMGTQNFVISMFQNFFARYPTQEEREAAELMVDGFSSQVFLQNGRTKEDFLTIFFGSRDYFEGEVRTMFRKYLFRAPGTQELESNAIAYRASHDFQALQIAIMSMDEFLGI